MTKNETFKRTVRARMAKTGERYSAARHALIEQTPGDRRRVWKSEPEFTDEVIRANTGRGWDDWSDLIDEWGGPDRGHTAIATFVREDHDIDGWWAQAVTVSYERIVGLRLPYQRSNGTFTANKSKTITIDHEELRSMLLDADDRGDLFAGEPTELRSRPTSKSIRIAIGSGSALFTLEPATNGRTKVVIDHESLPNYDDVAEWKFYWTEWLDALDES